MPQVWKIVAGRKKGGGSSPESIEPQPLGAGIGYSLYINDTGIAWSWGDNEYGSLGDNSLVDKCTPVSVAGATKTFCQIAGGGAHSVAIDKNGKAWAWGANFFGAIGDNSTSTRCTPVSVVGAPKIFYRITAGWYHTVAIDKNGRAWSWGYNRNGELGDGSTTSRRTPVSVAGATKTFCKISGGFDHTMAIDYNGRAWGWGRNSNGSIGDNTVSVRSTPASVAGATKTFCHISAGVYHTAAIDKNGKIWTWGRADQGQLGDNTTIQKVTPVSVAGVTKTFCQISAGGLFTVALDYKGYAFAWGNNQYGQLGNNSTTNRCTPVAVCGLRRYCHIVVPDNCHVVAIDINGLVWAWGRNDQGQLGDNTTTCRCTPVNVCNL